MASIPADTEPSTGQPYRNKTEASAFPRGCTKQGGTQLSVADGWHRRADIECTLRVGLGGCVRTILLPSRSLNQEVGFAIYASGS